jgi:hypothetical protein
VSAPDEVKAPRWGAPPPSLSLGPDEVHVWRASLKVVARTFDAMASVLSRAERRELERADDPKQEVGRLHLIRTLLAGYVGRDASRLRLRRGADGRPRLAGRRAPHFDLACCERRALLAVAARPVSVVIAAVPRDEAEVAARLERLPPRDARLLGFLSAHNRAQAVVGHEVEERALERLGAGVEGRVERLKVGGEHVGAVAAEGWDWSPSFWRRPDDA